MNNDKIILISTVRFLAVLLFYTCPVWLISQDITIAEARLMNDGATVQIEGIIINSPNERDLRFIQDSTGGIAIYAPGQVFNQNVRIGDRIMVRGELDRFDGLIEINEIFQYEIISGNIQLPPLQTFNEDNLASRIHLDCIIDQTYQQGITWGEGAYPLVWNSMEIEGWIPDGSDVANKDRMSEILWAEGIIYKDDHGLHFLIQEVAYDQQEQCLFWEQTPSLTNAGIDFLIFESELSDEAQLRVILIQEGQQADTIDYVENTEFESMIDPLRPATMYRVEWHAFNQDDTLIVPPKWYITQSTSSKDIDVFFNHPLLDTLNSPYDYTTRGIDLVEEIVARIEGARESIDVCLYNFNNESIKEALEEAQDRGIRVRCMVDGDNSNIGFRNTDLTVYRMAYGYPLMHNKFIVVDAGVADNAWLFMGATNLTPGQIFDDPNSALGIEDQMLARVYEKEFEELWGSGGPDFNRALARQGNEKFDNTPHQMFLQTIPVQSYFSPSDGTTNAIYEALSTAKDEVYFSLLTFTKNELRDVLIQLHESGVEVKGIIENVNDNGGEYYRLNNEGIEVLNDDKSRIHHHKYAIIDPGTDNAKLIVGSHNWTQKAEDTNDENTLILHDRDLVSLFRSEFYGRWCELLPNDMECKVDDTIGQDQADLILAPNPTTAEHISIIWTGEEELEFSIEVFDYTGRSIFETKQEFIAGMNNLSQQHSLIPGIYLISCQSDDYHEVLKIFIYD